jgi:cellulose synthase/poly-beta-1,6-N-acetylglucosamine synthase-like glycosyltransferase
MMLKAKNYKAGYLNEYLAIGEAPEEPRNIFRQRSRWCKGQMQVCATAARGLGCFGCRLSVKRWAIHHAAAGWAAQ